MKSKDIALISAIAKNVGGGGSGSELPEVTSSDNGSDLMVSSGAWGKSYPLSIIGMYNGASANYPDCIKDLTGKNRIKAFMEMVKQGKVIFRNGTNYYIPQYWYDNDINAIEFYYDTFTYQSGQHALIYKHFIVTVNKNSDKITGREEESIFTMTPYS